MRRRKTKFTKVQIKKSTLLYQIYTSQTDWVTLFHGRHFWQQPDITQNEDVAAVCDPSAEPVIVISDITSRASRTTLGIFIYYFETNQ